MSIILNLIKPRSRINEKNKFSLELTAYEIDLILKSLHMGYRGIDNEIFVFNDKTKDKECLYYLHRLISCRANEFFYNKINNDFFIYRPKSKKKY